MRNSTLSILSLSLMVLILGSCSTSSDLTNTSVLKKRRYMKGYQVNVKGNNIEKKSNSVTAEMESVEVKPINSNQVDNMAQASLSTEITKADLAASPVISITNESRTSEKAERELKSTAVKMQTESKEQSRRDRVSQKLLNRSNLVVPASTAVASGGESFLLYIILAIILPPLAVGLLYGIGLEFWISLVLTIIFWVPGIIYALIKVFQKF